MIFIFAGGNHPVNGRELFFIHVHSLPLQTAISFTAIHGLLSGRLKNGVFGLGAEVYRDNSPTSNPDNTARALPATGHALLDARMR